MTNPFPFVSTSILTADELNSIGDFADYTPTSVSWSAAGSFEFVKFAEVNGIVLVRYKFDLTGTPSGTFEFTQPVEELAGKSDAGTTGTAYLRDASAGVGYVAFSLMSGDSIRVQESSSTSNVTASNPFTWASGDSIRGLMIYEAA
jgi:hypothetical protein